MIFRILLFVLCTSPAVAQSVSWAGPSTATVNGNYHVGASASGVYLTVYKGGQFHAEGWHYAGSDTSNSSVGTASFSASGFSANNTYYSGSKSVSIGMGSPPSVTGVSLSPSPLYPSQPFTGSASFSDSNGDLNSYGVRYSGGGLIGWSSASGFNGSVSGNGTAHPTAGAIVKLRGEVFDNAGNGTTGAWVDFPVSYIPASFSFSGGIYTGSAQSVTVSASASYGSPTYTLSGTQSATNAGTYNATATANGNYTGSKSGTWTISPRSTSFNFSGGPNFTYAPNTPRSVSVSATVSGATYTTSGTYSATGAGNYTAAASANGNYSGSGSYNWSIAKANQPSVSSSNATIAFGSSFTPNYNGGAGTGAWQWYVSGHTSWGSGSWTPPSAGAYTFHVRRLGDSNYNTSSSAGGYTLTVGGTATTFSFSGGPTFTYNGSAKSVSVSPSPSNATYSISGTHTATNAGNYTASANATGNYAGSSSYNWTINPAAASFTFSGGPTFTYNGSAKSVSVSPSPSNATYSTSGTHTATNAGSYTASANATGNYAGSSSYNWTINPAAASFTFSGGPTFAHDGSSKSVSVSVSPAGATYTTSGTWSATNAGTYTATVTATGNYTGTASYTWSIAPPDSQAPSTPSSLSASNITSGGFALNWHAATDNVGVTGYRVRVNQGTPSGTIAGLSHTFSGLNGSTTHMAEVQARDAAGNWSDWSGLNVTTTTAGTSGSGDHTFWLDVDNDGLLDQVFGGNSQGLAYYVSTWYTENISVNISINAYWRIWDILVGQDYFSGYSSHGSGSIRRSGTATILSITSISFSIPHLRNIPVSRPRSIATTRTAPLST